MLNKNELIIVNEIVGKLEKDMDIHAVVDSNNNNDIILFCNGEVDGVYTDRKQFLKEMIQCLNIDRKDHTLNILRQKEATNHINILDTLLSGEKIKVSKNEYDNKCKNMADIYWNNPKVYFALIEELYEVLPFSINSDNEEVKRIINILCDTETEKENCIRYKGSSSEGDIYTIKESLDMTFIYNDSYSKSIFNDKLKLIVDYTEGDVYFNLYSNDESYKLGKENTIKFYKEDY